MAAGLELMRTLVFLVSNEPSAYQHSGERPLSSITSGLLTLRSLRRSAWLARPEIFFRAQRGDTPMALRNAAIAPFAAKVCEDAFGRAVQDTGSSDEDAFLYARFSFVSGGFAVTHAAANGSDPRPHRTTGCDLSRYFPQYANSNVFGQL